MKNYRRIITSLVAIWFTTVLITSVLGVFRTAPGRPPLALGLSVVIPIAAFSVWFARSEQFRQFILRLNPQALTFVQSWRIAGIAFVALYTYNILPGLFALPAGWGDVAIGATAPWVALSLANPKHRASFLFWQALGILDLVTAVGIGTTASLIDPSGISTSPMTTLPMSFIPTFGVPLFFILHLVSIAQARSWPAQNHTRMVPASRDSTSALSGADV
jgi:hypothetical protein